MLFRSSDARVRSVDAQKPDAFYGYLRLPVRQLSARQFPLGYPGGVLYELVGAWLRNPPISYAETLRMNIKVCTGLCSYIYYNRTCIEKSTCGNVFTHRLQVMAERGTSDLTYCFVPVRLHRLKLNARGINIIYSAVRRK